MRKKGTAICIISILIACLSLFAFPIIAYASAPVEQDEAWEEVASFDELVNKLEAMKTTGGNIRLTKDIVAEAGVDDTFSAPRLMNTPIKLDTGEYTITVRGKLVVTPFVEISGAGGEKGLFYVEDGGWLELYSISVKADSGAAIAQSPRSVLCYGALFEGMPEFVCEGEIKSAGPVAVPWSDTNPKFLQYVYVRDGERAEDVLPLTDEGALYENGSMDQNHSLDVAWDVDLFANRFAARESCVVTGSYPGATAYATPVCMVVFQKGRAATVLGGWGTGGTDGRGLSAQIQVALEKPQEFLRIDWSSDGENWQECEADMLEEQSGRLRYSLYPPDDAGYPFYISAVVSENGKEQYSNILILHAPGKAGDIGGNRGGGTDLTDPKDPLEPEPPENTENPDEPTINPPEDTGFPTATKPVFPPEQGLSTEPPGARIDVKTDEASGQDSKIQSGSVEKEEAGQMAPPLIAGTENKENLSVDMAEMQPVPQNEMPIEKDAAEAGMVMEQQTPQPEYPEQAGFQTALGAIISGGVIILAVAWNGPAGWGAKLSGWMKRLIHK